MAIASEFDFSEPTSLKDIRAILDVLKQSAESQVDSSFDPSGTSGRHEDSSTSQSSDRARSWHGDVKSEESQISTLSQSLDSLGIGSEDGSEVAGSDDIENSQYSSELERLSAKEKTTTLMEMFPTIKPFEVEYVLRKVGFHFRKAVEELLSQVFLKEEESKSGNQIIKKGVDGFIETETSRGRKVKGKKKRQRRGASASSALADSSITHGSWDRAKEEIDFIIQRTFFPHQTVSSVYHKSGASLAPTIAALCTASNPNPLLASISQSTLQVHISELSQKFPSLSRAQATALVYLSHPSTTSAHELAQVLTTSLESTPKFTPHYLLPPPSPFEKPAEPPFTPLPASTAELVSARSTAFAQANDAYRKSKSNRLMAGVAGYYSSVGREASASLRRHEAASAERLVTAQSKPGEVDLHGVHVPDAVRIAKEKVESWWEHEAGEWAREGKVMQGDLKIVTGVGRHSQGGKGKLGPAVGAMLVKEGWKVEFAQGFLIVLGKARR